jgi:hypothetical protein
MRQGDQDEEIEAPLKPRQAGIEARTAKKAAETRVEKLQTMQEELELEKKLKAERHKQALLYRYFTGNEFHHRMETILTGLRSIQEGLEREKLVLTRHWARREKQLEAMSPNLTGMSGDIQGLSGGEVGRLETIGTFFPEDEE